MRVDNLTRRFSDDTGGHLARLDKIGYGESGERPERPKRGTLFEHDAIARWITFNSTVRQELY